MSTTNDHRGAALDLVLEIADLLNDDLDRFTRSIGISRARLHLLWRVAEHPGGARQSHLAAELGVSPRNVTGLVDAVVADSLAVRRADPDDRRAVLVSLTDAGTELVEGLGAGRSELAHQLFARPGAAALRSFVDVAESVRDELRSLVERQEEPGGDAQRR